MFDSPIQSREAMNDLLSKQKQRLAYNNKTIYFSPGYLQLLELKAFAYDYYFFIKENNIPIDYFSDPKEYLSYYLEALLCTYAPQNPRTDCFGLRIDMGGQNYPIGEIDLDMLVKYISPEKLKSLLKKCSVQKLKFQDGFDIVQKFVNLCASLSKLRIKYWTEQVKCFSMILCLADLNEQEQSIVFLALANLIKEASKSAPVMAVEVFDAIVEVLNQISPEKSCKEKTLLLDALLEDTIYPLLIEQKYDFFNYLIRKNTKEVSNEVKDCIKNKIEIMDNADKQIKELYFFKCFYSKNEVFTYCKKHFDLFTAEQIFTLIADKTIPFDKRCESKLIETLQDEDHKRKADPDMRIFPDWLIETIDNCILLKLLGYDINLDLLKPYAHYSEQLTFIIDPDTFDYSKVDTDNYMWQNLIYSAEYQHYFIVHKDEVLSENLQKIFDLGYASKEQQKLVYGILLDKDKLRHF